MRRSELEHVIRAAAAIVSDEIVVVGSQAILGAHPEAPTELLVSQEADVYPLNHPERSIGIDGALGDGSQFHATFGYYAHGVGPETATLPTGWNKRLVPVEVETGEGSVRGWCLEAHDLALSKCVAGRERDWEFVQSAMEHGIVGSGELLARVDQLPLQDAQRQRVRETLVGISKKQA
jgi:hypothetical protein